MALESAAPPPIKRGRGRPRKHPLPVLNDEPPVKKRKYTTRTPTLRDSSFEHDTITLKNADDIPSDGDFLHSALKSDNNDPSASPGAFEENPVSPKTMRARTQSRPRRSYGGARSRGISSTPRPRYSSAAAAAAASQASDGYKPREERSWEEFHADLDIEAELMVYTADEVDGRSRPTYASLVGLSQPDAGLGIINSEGETSTPTLPDQIASPTPVKRRPGRPPRRPESMLSGLGSPPAPRIVPLPTHNPKERLNLPKPSYRQVQTFKAYEEDKKVRVEDYVDKSMAHVGYQESELFDIPRHVLLRLSESAYDDDLGAALTLASDHVEGNQPPHQIGDVEYDMDEQDERWLETINAHRKTEQVDPIKPSMFEIAITQIEREFYALEKRIPKPNPRHHNQARPRSSSAAAVNGEPWSGGDEPDSKCAICDEGDAENANAIIFCDGCDLAVHQECYGVPFIPEGQWFCRKCKEIGRGTPTCVFCPNIEGAFKQTNTLRWAHLLCAIWIPEVSIANTTYMEPIQDVEKVPRNRWGLVCYICQQRMGACIQCSNKACYQAFHVTCARRARLFLKMKASPTTGIDTTILRAFCDRHVPPEWRRDHDTDTAIVSAKRYYRKTLRNHRWADSQTAAALASTEGIATEPSVEVDMLDGGTNKRKKKEPLKTGWRLASGAPVVPSVVFTAVEQSLARFMLRKRKEFVAEACKYWTLKREARRGAALLKRLQLQLENFSTSEVTRRNFLAMGAAGRPKLVRRIDFAEHLQTDVAGLLSLAESIAEREQKKMEDAETLREVMDTVYFPVSELLWPILRKAQKLGDKSPVFAEGLLKLENNLAERHYSSVAAFSTDVGAVFTEAVAGPAVVESTEEHKARDINEIHSQLAPMSWSERQALSVEQKQQKAVAKRIIRAIKEPIESALRKEAALKGIPPERQADAWAKLDARLEACVSNGNAGAAGVSPAVSPVLRTDDHSGATVRKGRAAKQNAKADPIQEPSPPISSDSRPDGAGDGPPESSAVEQDSTNPDEERFLTDGGVPWYMRAFEPDGSTIHTEIHDPSRAMSEELSEIDDETLNDMDRDLGSRELSVDEGTANGRKTRKGAPNRSPKKTRASLKAGSAVSKSAKATPVAIRTTRAKRTSSIATPVAAKNGTAARRQSKPTRASTSGKAADDDTTMLDAPDSVVRTATSSRPRRGVKAEESEEASSPEDETEAERVAQEKRERYNAKRRAMRRKGH